MFIFPSLSNRIPEGIRLNMNSSEVIKLKRIENLKEIYHYKLIDFLEEKLPGTTIVLFGSYSYGEDNEKSDIDLAIIGSNQKQIDLRKFEKELNREISLNFFEDFKINKNLKSNIINGITLSGLIEL